MPGTTRFIRLVAFVAGLSAFVLLVVACGEDATDKYKQSMNPVMQQHWDAYGELVTQVDMMYSSLMSGQNTRLGLDDARSSMQELQGYLAKAEPQLVRIATEWTLMAPPPKAERFHSLTFEMMQLRIKGVQRNRLMLAKFFNSGTFDSEAAAEGEALFDESERVWLKILAEAKKLGEVEITQ